MIFFLSLWKINNFILAFGFKRIKGRGSDSIWNLCWCEPTFDHLQYQKKTKSKRKAEDPWSAFSLDGALCLTSADLRSRAEFS